MNEYEFSAGQEHAGLRLDVFVCKNIEGLSRSMAQKVIERGGALVNGRQKDKNYRISPGDTAKISVPEARPLEAAAQDIPLETVYEDADLLVVNKPKGMVAHPSAGNPDGTLVNALLAHCGESLSGIGGVLRPGIVHRIDKDTSGLLIVAKNDRAHVFLAGQIKEHSFVREYEAVVRGGFKAPSGRVDAAIGRSKSDRKKMAADPGGRRAVTNYSLIQEYPGYSHVGLALETGRTHQIRVHMALMGHYVAGDLTYGPKKLPAIEQHLNGQCLHAKKLGFRHPDGRWIEVESKLPAYFTDFLEKLGRL
ncbi:MAG: RluA family pseudouridine synthase [Oscillospiraceae bacterium]|jgi:23S rRNA pseudouridine1911/1915/1917 synthase|nr:RluA family pseudouridine synthase [Oscillospiraceae bacterium]